MVVEVTKYVFKDVSGAILPLFSCRETHEVSVFVCDG